MMIIFLLLLTILMIYFFYLRCADDGFTSPTMDIYINFYRTCLLHCRSWTLLPDLSTTPIIATRCRGDVLVDVATDVVFFTVPPGDVAVVVVLICSVCVCQSSFVLMNIYYADDGSLVSSP